MKAGTDILMRFSEQSLELVTVFEEIKLVNVFSLSLCSPKSCKTICACIDIPDLNVHLVTHSLDRIFGPAVVAMEKERVLNDINKWY
jgi:hypothetical protein